MRHYFLLIIAFIGFVALMPDNSFAQTKKLLVFKKGVAMASGIIKGEENKTLFFKVKKNTDLEIFFDEGNKGATFKLFKPNGKPFYEDGSVNSGEVFDLMDVLENGGIYKLIIQLPTELKSKNQPVKYTLRIVLK